MWCKILQNVPKPTVVYEFPKDTLEALYYTMAGVGSTTVEITKVITASSNLEQCAIDCAPLELQVQIYSAQDELVKAVIAKVETYMIFETGEKTLERLVLRVASSL